MSRILTIDCVPTCEGITIIDEINAALSADPDAHIDPHQVLVLKGSPVPEGRYTIPYAWITQTYVDVPMLIDLLLQRIQREMAQVERTKTDWATGAQSKDGAIDGLLSADGYLHVDAAMMRNMRYYMPMLAAHPEQAARLQTGMQALQDCINDFRNHDLSGIPRKKGGRKKAVKTERTAAQGAAA